MQICIEQKKIFCFSSLEKREEKHLNVKGSTNDSKKAPTLLNNRGIYWGKSVSTERRSYEVCNCVIEELRPLS
jgi:hypothetical protein